jgi:hypothetical protein
LQSKYKKERDHLEGEIEDKRASIKRYENEFKDISS